ncbi:hypothetical protein MNBD_CHLOROFLEXI01-4960 [hydrothermal vent metagenome]|uniref:Uncharacterized protein n=1 Tax=hydrothermal vent metagenome TaxID=652676 RepID=A0A3B0UIZ4_9ZZZZ
MKTLFNGELQSVLDDKKISEVLRDVSVAALSDEDVMVALHDPCDIRKAYSEKLENLGIVRDLKGNFINGYNTFNTVCVNGDGKRLHLSNITVYSNGDKAHYVKQAELDALVQKQVKSIKQKKPVELTGRETAILQLLEEANPKTAVWHVLDRQFDGVPLFEFIKYDLNDTFVIRLKISRNSNEKSVNQAGKAAAVKLKDVPLNGKRVEVLDKVRIKKKVYQQVKREIEWGTLILEGETYHVVRVTLLKRVDRPIFKHPMLLLTNQPVEARQEAHSIYQLYLMRSKIEEVFKFRPLA